MERILCDPINQLKTKTMFNNFNKDHFNIDSTPTDEKCAQVGSTDLDTLRLEAITFRSQLERQFGPFPEGFGIVLNRNSHDFGVYYDLKLCYIDDEGSPSLDKALEIESNVPEKWDNQSRTELQEKNYFMQLSAELKEDANDSSILKAS